MSSASTITESLLLRDFVFSRSQTGNGGLDLCRHLGCDVFLLDGWGTGHAFASPALVWGTGVQERWHSQGERSWRELRCPAGMLRAEYRRGHPVRFARAQRSR